MMTIVHSTVSVLLIISIIVQQRASGLGALGGASSTTVVQRRGAEKVIYKISIGLAVVFFALSIVRWYLF